MQKKQNTIAPAFSTWVLVYIYFKKHLLKQKYNVLNTDDQ